ncbi:MAG: hypothetical protein ACI3VR_04965 [Intestinibacter sp.]|uniref:hypothetical protein n=1 Tax=Intestinibacter sp. TaxID=1965304 RepID=UPI003F18B8EC
MDIVQYTCPNCGADLKFDPLTQDFYCEYCDSRFNDKYFDDKTSKINEMHLKKDKLNSKRNNLDKSNTQKNKKISTKKEAKAYKCPNCGAMVETTNTTGSTFCKYCNSPIILSDRLDDENEEPDKIIPFKITEKEAIQKCRNLFDNEKFVIHNNEIESIFQNMKVRGVYFPHWYVDVEADLVIHATSQEENMYEEGNIRYTHVKKYRHYREGKFIVKSISELAMKTKYKSWINSIYPYLDNGIEDFSTTYLSGFETETKDIDKSELDKKTKAITSNEVKKKASSYIRGFKNVQIQLLNESITNKRWSYRLLPVWILEYQYKDKEYVCVVNGQTGKTAGSIPAFKKRRKKSIAFFLIITVIFSLIIFFIGRAILL